MSERASREQFRAFTAAMLATWNLTGEQFAAAVFPGRHPSYLAEKAALWNARPTSALGALDPGNQLRFLEVALERYGEEADRYWAAASEQAEARR